MLFANTYFYYLTIGLQAICVIHCLRKGNQNKWIWIIVFLPVVGCIAYMFTEMLTRRDIQQVQSGMGAVFNPGGRIIKLEDNLRFSDTFQNKVALADAYLAAGNTDKAITLYESSLTGAFVENEYVLTQLIMAYFQKQRYPELIAIAKKIYKLPQFSRSKAHMLYAMALEYSGNYDMAEKEFRLMKSRFSYFEPRYQYGLFLMRANREEEARSIFREMLDEAPHLSSWERKNNRRWFNNAKAELRKIEV